MSDEITYRIEHDLYQDCLERIARKVEADGEEALALALKEHGFEKVVRCKDCRHSRKDGRLCAFFAAWEPIAGGDEYAEMPADVEPDGFCAWGERR